MELKTDSRQLETIESGLLRNLFKVKSALLKGSIQKEDADLYIEALKKKLSAVRNMKA